MDYLIKHGHVIDPKNNIDDKLDIAVQNNKILTIAKDIIPQDKTTIINAENCFITPGLIDLHAHVYWGGTPLGVDAREIYQRSGVTTFVDAGSAGAGNFKGFLEHVIKPSPVNILAFLNISFPGIFAFSQNVMLGEASILELMSIDDATAVAKQYREHIVGIKVRACQKAAKQLGSAAIELGLEVASALNLPVMTHVGSPPPSLKGVIDLLRPGDIITHAFRGNPNSFIEADGRIKECFYEARAKGIGFDLGHGMGGFSFTVAEAFAKENIFCDSLSSDVHILSCQGPAYDLLTTMSKHLYLGMPVKDIIKAVTHTPAEMIKQPQLGHLSIGAQADISLLKVIDGDFNFEDGAKQTRQGKQAFQCVGTLQNGHYTEAQ